MTTDKTRLLVVDFDFFFPMVYFPDKDWHLYDWGANEERYASIFHEDVWPIRAATLIANGCELPVLDGTQETFWDRFKFAPTTQLFFADSNARAARPEVFEDVTDVWLFDAHHDSGYNGDKTMRMIAERGGLNCGNWMIRYEWLGASLHMRYPTHRRNAFKQEPKPFIDVSRRFDNGKPLPHTFHRIFVCRSGAWVPSWCDAEFEQFIAACPVATKQDIGMIPRRYDTEQVEALVTLYRQMREEASA